MFEESVFKEQMYYLRIERANYIPVRKRIPKTKCSLFHKAWNRGFNLSVKNLSLMKLLQTRLCCGLQTIKWFQLPYV